MTTTTRRRLIPIYTTSGSLEAYLVYPLIFSSSGDWIGFITPEKDVYSVGGEYVGWLSDDRRILRKRATSELKPKLNPPPTPPKISVPSMAPLAPMMSDLPYHIIDVLEDEPDLLHSVDGGETREDLDY